MKKGIGDKVLGWFIVDEDALPSDATPDRNAPAPEEPAPARAPALSPALAPAPAIVAPGQPHDARAFATVYRSAGVADDERERLTKVLTLVESLPAEASSDVKRAIVAASLEAFGVSIDRILVTGEGALAALDGYVVAGEARTKDVLAQAEARIAKLTAEIAECRRLMDVQLDAQRDLSRAAAFEKARVRVVLDFFDSGASGRAAALPAASAPRLVRLK